MLVVVSVTFWLSGFWVRNVSSLLSSFLWEIRLHLHHSHLQRLFRDWNKNKDCLSKLAASFAKASLPFDLDAGSLPLSPPSCSGSEFPLVSHEHRSHHLPLGEVLWAWKQHLESLWRRINYVQGSGYFMICYRYIIQGAGLQFDFLFFFNQGSLAVKLTFHNSQSGFAINLWI